MGGLLTPIVDVATAIFSSGAPEEIAATAAPAFESAAPAAFEAAAPSIAEGVGDATYFLPAAGEALAPAETAITVGANAFAPAAGEIAGAAPGLFEGLGGAFTGGLGAIGSGISDFFASPAAAADLAGPGGTVPTAGGAPGSAPTAEGSMFGGLFGGPPNERLLEAAPVQAVQAGGQPVSGAGASPGVDPSAAVKNPVPSPLDQPAVDQTPIDQTPQGAQQAGQGINQPTNIGQPQTQPQPAGGAQQAAQAAGAQQPKTSGFWDTASKWAGPAIAAAGLGYSMLQNKKNQVQPTGTTGAQQVALAGQTDTTRQAVTAEGQQLASYIASGTLPPAFQQSLDQATNAAIVKAKSNAAANGQPTDPAKNTALAQSIQQIQQNAVVQSAQIMQTLASTGTSLLNSGLTMAQLQQSIYDSLIKTDQAQTAATGKAIANFASALSNKPSSQPLIQLGGTQAA